MTKTKSNIVIATTLLLAIGIAAGYIIGEPLTKLFKPTPTPLSTVEEGAGLPSGTLFMTLKPRVPNEAASIHRVSIRTGEITSEGVSGEYFAPSYSNDNTYFAAGLYGAEGDMQLAIVSTTNNDDQEFASPPAPATEVGASQWSQDGGSLLYEAIAPPSAPDDTSTSRSYVVLLDVETLEQEVLDEGTSPRFAPDGSVLYLKHDGIYRRILPDDGSRPESERLAYFEDYDATLNSQLALSPDGTLLIVTHPESVGITSYAVDVIDGEVILIEGRGDRRIAAWPTFSPDGTYLALIEFQQGDEGNTEKVLSVIQLATGRIQAVTSLAQYDDTFLSLTKWLQ